MINFDAYEDAINKMYIRNIKKKILMLKKKILLSRKHGYLGEKSLQRALDSRSWVLVSFFVFLVYDYETALV